MTTSKEGSAKQRPYPAYQDSGIPWIGGIPVGWEMQKIKTICQLDNGFVFPPDSWAIEGTPIIRIENFTNKEKFNYSQLDVPKRHRVSQGDLLFSWSASLGPYIWDSPGDYFLNQHIFKIVSHNNKKWLYYNLLAAAEFLRTQMHGSAMTHITRSKLDNIFLAVPPDAVQQAIATFLDRETARIDELLREQEALLEDLGRKRQNVITAAVTGKLLETSGPTRSVENIGPIPAHWQVMTLKRLAQIRGGVTKGRDLQGKSVMEVPYLRVANVQDGHLNLEDVATILIGADELARYALQPGDVLMNEGGDNDKLGRGAVWQGQIDPCVHQNHVFSVRPHAVEPNWLALVNASDYAKFFFFVNSKQSTNLASISSSTIKELPVVMPPREERLQLLAAVAEHHAQIDALTEEVRASIALMRQHRSALITAAVTGKIDVRQA